MIIQMKGNLFGKQHNLKCYGSATVGERGQLVLPAEIRKLFGIGAGNRLIVLGSDYADLQTIALIKSADVAKIFEFMEEMEKMVREGGKGIEDLQKEGLKKIQALKESGIGSPEMKSARKKK